MMLSPLAAKPESGRKLAPVKGRRSRLAGALDQGQRFCPRLCNGSQGLVCRRKE